MREGTNSSALPAPLLWAHQARCLPGTALPGTAKSAATLTKVWHTAMWPLWVGFYRVSALPLAEQDVESTLGSDAMYSSWGIDDPYTQTIVQ